MSRVHLLSIRTSYLVTELHELFSKLSAGLVAWGKPHHAETVQGEGLSHRGWGTWLRNRERSRAS